MVALGSRSRSRFEFGKNWQDFLSTVGKSSVADAEFGLGRLLPNGEITGASFLDIGCGSGLSMLAAKRLGAKKIIGIDLDAHSVEAARQLLAGHNVQVIQTSILDATPRDFGVFDIVYSWGVLHHTGDMWQALERAASLVRKDGLLAIAIYRKTPLCPLWAFEKRLYTSRSRPARAVIRGAYKAAFLAALAAGGRNPLEYVRGYRPRGMSWHHDVHDWLGGYPYELASRDEIKFYLDKLGFQLQRSFEKPARASGLFGSHCDEFVAKKVRA